MRRKTLLLFFLMCAPLGFILGGIAAQYVVTDCGTVHQISTNASSDHAVMMQEYYSLLDCN